MCSRFINFIFMLSMGVVFSQISVKSFRELPMDTDARIFQKETPDGDKCALIKVVTTIKNFDFSVGHAFVCDVQYKTAEIFLYVSEETRYITIRHPRLGLLRRYKVPMDIRPLHTYEMVLQTAKITTIVEETVNTQWVVIDSKPSGAKVFINGNDTGRVTPYQAELMLGKHYYRLEKVGYKTSSGNFVLKMDNKEEIMVPLPANYSKVLFKTNPFVHAKIKISGALQSSKTPLTKNLNAGNYVVEMKHPQYHNIKKVVVVKGGGKQQEVVFKMRPRNGHLKIVSEPYGAEIFINGKSYGTTPKTIRNILIGSNTIKLTKQGYYDSQTTVVIKENQITSKKFKLTSKNNYSTTQDENADSYVQAQVNQESKGFDNDLGFKISGEVDAVGPNSVYSAFYMWHYFMMEFQYAEQHEDRSDSFSKQLKSNLDLADQSDIQTVLDSEKNSSNYRDARKVSSWQINLVARIPMTKNFYAILGLGLGAYRTFYNYTHSYKVKQYDDDDYDDYGSWRYKSWRYKRSPYLGRERYVERSIRKSIYFTNFQSELFTGFHWHIGNLFFLEGKLMTTPYRTFQSGVSRKIDENRNAYKLGTEGFFNLGFQVGLGIRLF